MADVCNLDTNLGSYSELSFIMTNVGNFYIQNYGGGFT
jgi:hypothetical protein